MKTFLKIFGIIIISATALSAFLQFLIYIVIGHARHDADEWKYHFVDDVIIERLIELQDNPPTYKWEEMKEYRSNIG